MGLTKEMSHRQEAGRVWVTAVPEGDLGRDGHCCGVERVEPVRGEVERLIHLWLDGRWDINRWAAVE